MMEKPEESPADERGLQPPDRGLLHVWPSGGGTQQLCPETVLLSRPVMHVSLGENHGILLAQGGLVFSFGELFWRGISVPVSAPVLEASLLGRTVVHVAAGGFHCGAISEQGGVYMWGENTAGQCGQTDRASVINTTVPEPCPVTVVDSEVIPPAVVRVVSLACGREHSLALSAQNELWAWGSGCQLGLVTNTFPVWKPQKVEHLAGRHVIQVACGAYHSLALVRSLPAQDFIAQSTPKIRERGRSPQCPLADREELVTTDDVVYCPLGVELSEVTRSETSSRRRVPRPRLHPAGKSSGSSCGSSASLSSFSDDSRSNPKQKNFPACSRLEAEENRTECMLQTDGSPKANPASDWAANKDSAFSDDLELLSLFDKLSVQSESQNATATGDTDSVSSQTGSEDSCISSTPSSDLLTSSYKDDSIFKMQTNNGVASAPLSSSPVCLEEVRLCVERERQAPLSCSLTNAHQKGNAAAASGRRSLPGTPTHGSPRRRHQGASGSLCAGAGSDDSGDGLPSLETEVWSWGRGSEGQLGHGDQLARLQPLCINSLTGQEVIKVAAGSHHSLALTAQCQVYSWGSNLCGQLGRVDGPATVPQLIKLSDGLRVWDLSAGQSHSLLLADGDCVQPVLLYCGQKSESPSAQSEKLQSQSSSQSSPLKAKSCTARPALLPFCIEMSYISSVSGGGRLCAALMDHNVMGFIAAIHDLASRERRFSCWMNDVRRVIIAPLRKKETACQTLGDPCTHLFFALCDSFIQLSKLIGRHATALSYFLQNAQSRDVTSFALLKHSEHFLETYKKYCSAVGDFQVMGGFQSLHKLSLDWLCGQQAVLSQLCGSDQSVSKEVDLVSMFYQPLQQLHHYSRVLLKMATCYDVLTEEYQSLHQGCSHYEVLSLSLLRKKKEAETTQLFWKTHSGKTTESLRLPQRRVVCESSNRSLTPQYAGRFSNHWFILFNDILVHTQGSLPPQSFFSSFRIYPLTCLWVKTITEDGSGLYTIKIICPEESLVLVASTPQEKNKWLRSLNQAVDLVLGGAAQGSSPGVTAAVCRTASYKFVSDERFKDAQYSGGWMAGRVHGRGTMKWPDGRVYKGNFKGGLEDGYGECVMPNKVQDKPDVYQGQWKEGKIHGFGKYKYGSGEVYDGCFCDGRRHGYGMLSSGKLAGASSGLFIGQWVQDKKTGYGVHDDITRGEKFMGFWLDDQRHSSAVVLTQYGVYFEGSFKENKMSGSGLLVSDDDTVFHGEFSDDWTINGKGVLTLANGDRLDGLFSGEWSAGLKVVGTYVKPAMDDNKEKDEPPLGQYAVPAAQRWICVFDECWSRLGCDAAGRGERTAAWENIAVTIATARRQSPDLSKSHTKVLESLEFIPQYGEAVTTANYDNIRRYLTKACETPHHPLGWLVETLVTAYRMTYVGVGSNRRLLRQAVLELQAYLTHFYSIVRFLFPGLPDDGGVIPDAPDISPYKTRRNSNKMDQGVLVVSCSSLLLPLLLPRLYPPLFTLYCLQQEPEEAQYWERILRLNKQPDQALLGFLGVQEKFWPHWMSILGEKKQIVSSSKDACFISAVETLQQISTTFTPSDKLLVIQKTFEELTLEVKPFLAGDFLWCMDDLFPLFLYVVLRARVRNLGAEVSLIEDLMDPNLQHGEMGLMFTTLKACFIQIQQESTT
ncbi:alsin-like isoform X1 [Xiphophorus couchianus]|uniref:alsin-like isoform X1 n=1 Tax=Xiphophorus couchianus TaxID=32473 RepID=UPI0010166534|nr:alsin-like isoform X1 [Xiphophorus couchianus]XP_027878028.1 alsin-like isoform X1 [Xiphophorus couchianus]XP_027878029.1 alsin-like isoform X1 [Xiphophorus couchianus]